jgi:hypothetical protein
MALAISNGRTPWQHPVERDGFAGQQGGVGSGVLEPTSHIVLTNEAQPLVQLRYDGVYQHTRMVVNLEDAYVLRQSAFPGDPPTLSLGSFADGWIIQVDCFAIAADGTRWYRVSVSGSGMASFPPMRHVPHITTGRESIPLRTGPSRVAVHRP